MTKYRANATTDGTTTRTMKPPHCARRTPASNAGTKYAGQTLTAAPIPISQAARRGCFARPATARSRQSAGMLSNWPCRVGTAIAIVPGYVLLGWILPLGTAVAASDHHQ